MPTIYVITRNCCTSGNCTKCTRVTPYGKCLRVVQLKTLMLSQASKCFDNSRRYDPAVTEFNVNQCDVETALRYSLDHTAPTDEETLRHMMEFSITPPDETPPHLRVYRLLGDGTVIAEIVGILPCKADDNLIRGAIVFVEDTHEIWTVLDNALSDEQVAQRLADWYLATSPVEPSRIRIFN